VSKVEGQDQSGYLNSEVINQSSQNQSKKKKKNEMSSLQQKKHSHGYYPSLFRMKKKLKSPLYFIAYCCKITV